MADEIKQPAAQEPVAPVPPAADPAPATPAAPAAAPAVPNAAPVAANPEPTAPQLPEVKDQKSFSLTPGETQMLVLVQQNQNSIFSILLSHIAGSRLAYGVTERTQFVLNGTLTEMKVGELVEQVPQATTAPAAGAAGDSAAVASTGGQVA